MRLPRLIGITGQMYAGKSTLGLYLNRSYGYKQLAFGDPLKRMLIDAGMCTHDECYGKKTEKSRWLLQKVGTEIFRKQVHPDFWVQRTAELIRKELMVGNNVVVDDVRFPNEAKLIKSYLDDGLLVRVVRDYGANSTLHDGAAVGIGAEHDSERFVNKLPADNEIVAASGDIDKLYREIELLLANRRPA